MLMKQVSTTGERKLKMIFYEILNFYRQHLSQDCCLISYIIDSLGKLRTNAFRFMTKISYDYDAYNFL